MSTLRYTSIPSTKAGANLNVLLCLPEGRPRAVLQMTHGMVEYIGRYEELARTLADHGIAAVGHDHLGHGGSVAGKADYGYFGPDGNRLLLEDIHAVTRWAKALPELAGLPWFLLGHSMGSFYARQYLCEYGDELAGAILMGTGWQPKAAVLAGRAVCHLLAACKGWRYRSRGGTAAGLSTTWPLAATTAALSRPAPRTTGSTGTWPKWTATAPRSGAAFSLP